LFAQSGADLNEIELLMDSKSGATAKPRTRNRSPETQTNTKQNIFYILCVLEQYTKAGEHEKRRSKRVGASGRPAARKTAKMTFQAPTDLETFSSPLCGQHKLCRGSASSRA
jgi:hypothetical protein